MRDLLLQPSPDLPNKIEGNINENVEPLIQAQKEALSNPAIVLHNKKLIDKIQGIVTLEEAFHQLVDTDCRWYREILCAYVTDPNSVSINERQAMAHELDLLFDGLNAEVSAALETIEAMFVPDALQRAGIFVPIR